MRDPDLVAPAVVLPAREHDRAAADGNDGGAGVRRDVVGLVRRVIALADPGVSIGDGPGCRDGAWQDDGDGQGRHDGAIEFAHAADGHAGALPVLLSAWSPPVAESNEWMAASRRRAPPPRAARTGRDGGAGMAHLDAPSDRSTCLWVETAGRGALCQRSPQASCKRLTCGRNVVEWRPVSGRGSRRSAPIGWPRRWP
jgi:hypothetical protein